MISFLKSFSSNIHYKYSIQQSPQFTTGCWSVYDAKNKTTNEPVSVLVLSKKVVAKLLSRHNIDLHTAQWEEIKNFANHGVHQLTKIRHPGVIKVVEPVESSKGTLTFVTERLVSTVQTIREDDLDDITVVRGMTTVAQAINFLHTSIGMVHLNVQPDSIIVDAQGDWKLMGFEFAVKLEDTTAGSFMLPQRDPRLPSYMHPCYNYLAPELVLDKMCVPANDVWGIAAVLFYIYMRRPPLNTHGNPNEYRDEYSRFSSKLATSGAKFPQKLRPYLESLFCRSADGRITIDMLETTDFFHSPQVKALKGIDEYQAKPVDEKVAFLKHLEQLVPTFPKNIRLRKIVKFAVAELGGPREPTTGVALGNVLFTAAHDMSSLSFSDEVLPVFASLTDYMPFQESVAANIDLVVRSTSDKDFSKLVLPLLVDVLKHHDAQHVPLQTAVLKATAVFSRNLTVPKMEQLLFPAVIDCFAATPARSVKVAATESLGVLVERGSSKTLILDRLIPALCAMKTRDTQVVVAVAKLWQTTAPRLSSEEIFTLVLPHLLDCSLTREFTVAQFTEVMNIIRAQIDTVQKAQVKLLAHNKPDDDDDWLNEPATTTLPEPKSEFKPESEAKPALFEKKEAPLPKLPAPKIAPTISPPRSTPNQWSLNAQPKQQPVVVSQSFKPALQPSAKPSLQPAFKPSLQSLQPPLQPASPSSLQASLQPSLQPAAKMPSLGSFSTPLVPTNKVQPSKLMPPMQPTTQSLPNSSGADEFGDFISSKQYDSLI